MTSSDLVTVLQDTSGSLATYWNILIAGGGAIICIIATGKSFGSAKKTKWILSVLFVVFAMSNLKAIDYHVVQHEIIVGLLPEGDPYESLAKAFAGPIRWQVVAFHLVIQAIVVILICIVPWAGKNGAEQGEDPKPDNAPS